MLPHALQLISIGLVNHISVKQVVSDSTNLLGQVWAIPKSILPNVRLDGEFEEDTEESRDRVRMIYQLK